ncbi:MAG: hypothetical protein IPH63_17325 [Flavobacteriales bacterium]|nr:hypothetical protein [Flavobacteriales bacterium]
MGQLPQKDYPQMSQTTQMKYKHARVSARLVEIQLPQKDYPQMTQMMQMKYKRR